MQDDEANDIQRVLMWHMCMSREFPLVSHTHITIEDIH
jgi:hypothetical protein